MFFGVLLLAWLVRPVMGAAAGPGRAAVTIYGSAEPHVNSWATLRLTLPSIASVAGSTFTVDMQDLRGGPIIRRRLAVFRRHLLMPMPCVIAAGGFGGHWPVIITVRHAGHILRVLRLNIDMPPANMVHSAWIAVRRSMQSTLTALSSATGRPLIPMVFTMHQLAASPVLNFASCRWLLLDRATAHALSRRRALALMSLGVRLLSIGARPPGILPASAWRSARKSSTGESIWTTPKFDGFSHGPSVVVPQLGRLRLPRLFAPSSWNLAAWAIGPVTMLMLILLYWAVSRRRIFILCAAIGTVLLAASSVIWLTASTPLVRTAWHWQTYVGRAALQVRTAIAINRSPHPSGLVTTDAHNLVLPLAWSQRAWFAFHGVVALHRNTASLAYPVAHHVRILAYQTQAAVSPAWPGSGTGALRLQGRPTESGAASGQSVLFSGGEIFLPQQPHQGRDFYNWLGKKNSMIQSTLRLWLRLQFNPHRRYKLLTGRHGVKILALPRRPA